LFAGKAIFHNIQNFLSFQLSTAAAALTLITLSTMFGLSNPLNAMQILFINILMDGPPSQSLGVDPVDPAIMRKPPRKKDAQIITRQLLYRVLFSASMIVIGTLFVYVFALSDDHMSRREQTMVSHFQFCHDLLSVDRWSADIHVVCVPGSRVGCAKSRSWMWTNAEPDAGWDGNCVIFGAAGTGVCAVHAGCVQDGSAGREGSVHTAWTGWCVDGAARG
jgi:magnesium-transporting ATPase (P-type)